MTFNHAYWARRTWPEMLTTVCNHWSVVDQALTDTMRYRAGTSRHISAQRRFEIHNAAALEIHNHIRTELPAWMFDQYLETVHATLERPYFLQGQPDVPYEM